MGTTGGTSARVIGTVGAALPDGGAQGAMIGVRCFRGVTDAGGIEDAAEGARVGIEVGTGPSGHPVHSGSGAGD